MKNRDLTPADWLDAAAVLVLFAIAMAGWATTYAGYSWWVVAVVAAFVSVLAALGLVSSGLGLGSVTATLTVGYLICAGPVAEGVVRLSGGEFLGDGVLGTGRSFERLATTLPPVAGDGALLLAPLLLALVGAGGGSVLALRSRRPALPLAPLLLVLVVVLVMGRHEPTSIVLQGGAFGVLSVLWLMNRAARLEPAVQGSSTVWSRGVAGLVLVALAAVVAMGLAGTASGSRFVLRDHVAGYDASGLETPLDDFRSFTRQARGSVGNVHTKQLLRLYDAPEGLRLRFAVLDSYDGESWSAGAGAEHAEGDNRFLRISSAVATEDRGRTVDIGVRPAAEWDRPWVPTAGSLTAIGFAAGRVERIDQLRYNPATTSAVMTDRLTAEDYYRFTARLTPEKLLATMNPGPDLDRAVRKRAAFLDEPADAWSAGQKRPMDRLFKVAERLRREGFFTHGAEPWAARYPAGHSAARLGRGFLLTVPTAGDEEQYAAAMALLAVRLGVPARVVVGAVVPSDGVIRGRDVSAWVEVQIRDGSWRTLPTEAFTAARPAQPSGPVTLPPRSFPPPKSTPGKPKEQPRPPVKRTEPDEPEADEPTIKAFGRSLRWPLTALAVLVLVGVAPGVKLVRRVRRQQAPRVSTQYAGAWLELVDRARDLGVDVPLGAPRPAQAAAIAGLDTESPRDSARSGSLARLAGVADSAIYGRGEADGGAARTYWVESLEVRRSLGADLPRWRRWLATLTPRSLFRS